MRDAPDKDVAWALAYVREEAEICSAVNGSDDESTKEARRLETTVFRLAREAGRMAALDMGEGE